MPEYARPAVAALDFRDESGATIRYGSRWGGPPPDDSYSRVSNPQRFAPVLTITDVLIEHLRIKYRAGVAVLDESSPRWVPTTTKLIGVTPDRPGAAPLLFRYTDFPGIEIWAGLRYSAAFPSCGCDACDETWESAAGDIELLVFAVTVILIHCYYGYHASGGPAGVGIAVGKAVRTSIVAINVIDLFLSMAIWGATTTVRLAG